MTNSEVLQLIIDELSKTTQSWNGDKELFELIFAPIPYGHDISHKRKLAKVVILDIFKSYDNFNVKTFHTLANNIICGENKDRYTQELLDFLDAEMIRLEMTTDINLTLLVKDIPCKGKDEQDYKTNFYNWKKGKIQRINNQAIKKRLEQNFDFPPSLWDRGEIFIKTTIKDGVSKFAKQQTGEILDIFDELRKEFGMETTITENEIKQLKTIKQMTQAEVMEFIAKQYPLAKNCSQEFIQKMIPIFYAKGYYELLLDDIITALDMHLQDTKQIKKIKAHILGSPIIGEYMQAFDLLSSIHSDNDIEIIDMRTEAISNMRRHQLSKMEISKEEKKEIIKKLISYYEKTFKHNQTYHYYPAINLVYVIVISFLVEEEDNQQHLNKDINDIYEKAKPSIQKEKKSSNLKERYYANITELEFMLLKGTGNPTSELERFLEMDEENIPSTELGRTQRQIQFFVDTIISLNENNTSILDRMQRAIEIIDDFLEYREG